MALPRCGEQQCGSRATDGRGYRAAVRELLPDEAALEAAEAEPSVLLGDVRVDQAQLPRLVEDGPRELHGAVVLRGDGHHLLLRKLACLPVVVVGCFAAVIVCVGSGSRRTASLKACCSSERARENDCSTSAAAVPSGRKAARASGRDSTRRERATAMAPLPDERGRKTANHTSPDSGKPA